MEYSESRVLLERERERERESSGFGSQYQLDAWRLPGASWVVVFPWDGFVPGGNGVWARVNLDIEEVAMKTMTIYTHEP